MLITQEFYPFVPSILKGCGDERPVSHLAVRTPLLEIVAFLFESQSYSGSGESKMVPVLN
jgi:hypothetical protein